MAKKRHKTAKTIKDYEATVGLYSFTVPAGSTVSNGGYDDSYHFLQNCSKLAKEVTGFPNSILLHDLTYRGLNIPAEYCEPYPKDEDD